MILLDLQHETEWKAALAKFEGRVCWPYIDGPGNVTVGVGCLIASRSEFERMKWIGGMGTVSLSTEWNTLKAATPGLMAAAYKSLTDLVLPDDEVDALLNARIASTEADVIHSIPNVSAMPQAAKTGILDMAFNMGMGRFHEQFFGPGCKFGPAIARSDWQEAENECIRRGIQKSRNDWTQSLFRSLVSSAVT